MNGKEGEKTNLKKGEDGPFHSATRSVWSFPSRETCPQRTVYLLGTVIQHANNPAIKVWRLGNKHKLEPPVTSTSHPHKPHYPKDQHWIKHLNLLKSYAATICISSDMTGKPKQVFSIQNRSVQNRYQTNSLQLRTFMVLILTSSHQPSNHPITDYKHPSKPRYNHHERHFIQTGFPLTPPSPFLFPQPP